MALTDVLSLAEAKAGLNLANQTKFDAELPAWITGTSQALDKEIGPVVRRTVTGEEHDGGECVIFLRYQPVSAVTAVTEHDGTTATTLTEETNAVKPADGFIVDPWSVDRSLKSRILRRRSSDADKAFTPGRRNVVVTYTAGRVLDTASVSERHKRAAVLILSHLWQSQRPDVTAIGGVQAGEFDVPSVNFPRFAIPNAVRDRLSGLLRDEIEDPLPGIA